MTKDYVSALANTPKYAATEFLYGEYINGHPELKTSQEAAVAEISAMLDKQLEAHSVSEETICDYEEAAKFECACNTCPSQEECKAAREAEKAAQTK